MEEPKLLTPEESRKQMEKILPEYYAPSAEETERKTTMKSVEQLAENTIDLTEKEYTEFKEAIGKCDFYNSLRTYMNIEHYLQRSKDHLNDLHPMDPTKWDELMRKVDSLERKARETATNLSKDCICQTKEPFKYVTELPKE